MDEKLEDKLRRVTQQRKVNEELGSQQRYQEASRRRLARILKKKITTSFIGALARFETFFGPDIWGHGKPEEDCTPEQLAWREVWEQCRTEVLNNGNNQLRAVENEIVQYCVNWNRYQTTLSVKDSEEKDGNG
jgi:hypothetical protein